MEIPKFDETFIPILEILKSGKVYKTRELIEEVKKRFYTALTEVQLKQETKSGDLLIDNRIAWGKSYLKKGGYVLFPERGHVQITEKGKNHKSNLTVRDLENESNLFDFYKQEQQSNSGEDKINVVIASPQDLIDSGFATIQTEVKTNLLERLKEIDPYYFEKVILILLKRMGYGDFIETSKSGDGGIDGIINEDKLGLEKIYTQAKRYNENKVREKDIRNFIGAMSGDTRKGVFITTSTFDQSAVTKAREAHHSIILIDGAKLVDLMHQYNVGVQVKTVYEVKELDNDFFEEN
jgi:restriction system protein